jgi:hypothetical protein
MNEVLEMSIVNERNQTKRKESFFLCKFDKSDTLAKSPYYLRDSGGYFFVELDKLNGDRYTFNLNGLYAMIDVSKKTIVNLSSVEFYKETKVA